MESNWCQNEDNKRRANIKEYITFNNLCFYIVLNAHVVLRSIDSVYPFPHAVCAFLSTAIIIGGNCGVGCWWW